MKTSAATPRLLVESLQTMANRLRKHSLVSTTEAGSGHPSSCLSCADLISALFFRFLRFDVQKPNNPFNDRFILSKGHAAPVLWAAWAEAGAFSTEKLLTLRKFDSDLEGHPTPRSPWVDVATGSLGQGLSMAVGMALASKIDQYRNRFFVLIGDGEMAEGSVWEAAALASHRKLDNLIALLDVNRLGQSQETMYGHDLQTYERRFQSFGWHTLVIDGHNIDQIVAALQSAIEVKESPAVVIARTIKGKGVSFLEDRNGWHGKPILSASQLQEALAEIGDHVQLPEPLEIARPERSSSPSQGKPEKIAPPNYTAGQEVATREAYGYALQKLGAVNPNLVVLDGDTKNSTYAEKFLSAYPNRFVECFIAEQNMVGTAIGLSALGKIAFASTFACFLTRAYDHIRMAAVSQANLKLCGSHAGVSIGEDGPSQMGLEDLAMMRAICGSTVLYPSDAISAERMVVLAAETQGIFYIRTSRPKTPVIYPADETFEVGGSKVLRSSPRDRATIVSAGVTLHEALKACAQLGEEHLPVRVIDLYSVKPVDVETLQKAARETGAILTVEDHYPEGGLGDAVLAALAGIPCQFKKLAVTDLPRSGSAAELMDRFGISARGIVEAVKQLTGGRN